MKNKIISTGYSFGEILNEYPLFRQVLKVVWHVLGIIVTYWFAFLLRFDGNVPAAYITAYFNTLPVLVLFCVGVFFFGRNLSGLWSYFSVDDLIHLASLLAVSLGMFGVVVYSWQGWAFDKFPRSILVLEYILLGIWLTGGRLGARYIRRYRLGLPDLLQNGGDRMLLVGRLHEADMVIRESKQKGLGTVVGIVGDDEGNRDLFLHGIKVFHRTMDEVGELAAKIKPDSILMLPPFNRPRQINEIMDQVAEAGVKCKFRTLPSLADLAAGHLTASAIRSVDIEDLLGRGEVSLDRSDVRRFLKGKSVMITGAGGSIGSELARQIAEYEPAVLVLYEQSEFGLYMIEQELQGKHPNLKIIAVAGDIRHPECIKRAIDTAGKVDVIYHAAAYKHVPLMEKNVPACFRTNVLGTARLAKTAVEAGVDRFVMISSDKAVRPSSIMGATKRIAERILTEMESGDTTFVSVRFGNVLGSSGSVVPLFKRQIQAGGPVTVTSEDMRRFFMTIPEAVDLVLQAGTVGRHREIMVLEMGQEVKIIDLARRLIELSGLVPDQDIKIKVTGLRPGEKEYEEIITEDENVVKTSYEKIWVMTKNEELDTLQPIDLVEVEQLVQSCSVEQLRKLAGRLVPENCFPDATFNAP